MNVLTTDIQGVLILEPKVFTDQRGYFFESYSKRVFDREVAPVEFVQDNESMSARGVVRGIHFQRPPFTQSKLVRCVEGAILDVVVDLRASSPTYGRHIAVELSAANHRQLFIPKGMGHGFTVLSQKAVFQYKCDAFYAPEADDGINPLDPTLAIDWHLGDIVPILSEKDCNRQSFKDFISPFA